MKKKPVGESRPEGAPSSDDLGFVNPDVPEGGSSSDDEQEYLDPEGVGAESSPTYPSVMSALSLLENRLADAAASGVRAANQRSGGTNVVGVGLGHDSLGGAPGDAALVVFIEDEADEEEVRRELVDACSVQEASDDGLPIQIVTTGFIEAQSTNRSKFRPAPAGVSVGHFAITAGTIGGWARGKGARANRLLMVSNNHVLANSNGGRIGDSIIQPGRADGGVNTADRIAILERFVPINFASGTANFVDCATGWCWPDRVRRDWVHHVGAAPKFFSVKGPAIEPTVGRIVGKTGRTTNLTQGRITAVSVSINVNFGAAGVAHFRDQFSVKSLSATGTFSAGGDSGSFVWSWDSVRRPIGLLFAGGGGTTFCNRMSRVVSALDITLI